MSHQTETSFFRQPKAVWATAFAAMVGFMGIGLVDPILTSIAKGLNASHTEVSLLFTSYFAVTAVMMLVTGILSSFLGGRVTLLIGAAFIIIFAALSGTSDSVQELVGYRAGWGFGNAIFVATALSVIVGAASGGAMTAILLYEAAMGLGISSGPLLGAALGSYSWRYPFFGTAGLMLIAFIAIACFLGPTAKQAKTTSIMDPIRALGHKGLSTTAVTAAFYFYGFFTILAFVPFVLDMPPHSIGLIYFAWGLALAVFSVFVAPWFQKHFPSDQLIFWGLTIMAVLLGTMAVANTTGIIMAVIAAGAVMGVNSTVFTEMAMEISGEPRPIASAAYNFVRWSAGVIAPYSTPKIAEHYGNAVAFGVAATACLIGVAVIWSRRHHLGRFSSRSLLIDQI